MRKSRRNSSRFVTPERKESKEINKHSREENILTPHVLACPKVSALSRFRQISEHEKNRKDFAILTCLVCGSTRQEALRPFHDRTHVYYYSNNVRSPDAMRQFTYIDRSSLSRSLCLYLLLSRVMVNSTGKGQGNRRRIKGRTHPRRHS